MEGQAAGCGWSILIPVFGVRRGRTNTAFQQATVLSFRLMVTAVGVPVVLEERTPGDDRA